MLMDEATAAHLALIKGKRDKLQAEIDRIEAEWADPLQAQADRAGKVWDEMIRQHRLKHCRCHHCNRQFDTEKGLNIHLNSCASFKAWRRDRLAWEDGGRQGLSPKPRYLHPPTD